MNRWRHNNDIIIKKFLYMFKTKFPTKRTFRIFPILRIKGMVPICNLFIKRHSYNIWKITVSLQETVLQQQVVININSVDNKLLNRKNLQVVQHTKKQS